MPVLNLIFKKEMSNYLKVVYNKSVYIYATQVENDSITNFSKLV